MAAFQGSNTTQKKREMPNTFRLLIGVSAGIVLCSKEVISALCPVKILNQLT